MSNRQFFVWSGWAIGLVVGLPGLLVLFAIMLPTSPALAVVEKGDFPDSYSVSREDMPWRIYPGIPETYNVNFYRIIVNKDGPRENQQWGHVTVVQYPNPHTLDQAYEAIRSEAEINQNAQSIPFGERGSQSTLGYFNSSDVLFQRCGAVAHVTLEDGVIEQLVDYAHRLDQRIVATVCKK